MEGFLRLDISQRNNVMLHHFPKLHSVVFVSVKLLNNSVQTHNDQLDSGQTSQRAKQQSPGGGPSIARHQGARRASCVHTAPTAHAQTTQEVRLDHQTTGGLDEVKVKSCVDSDSPIVFMHVWMGRSRFDVSTQGNLTSPF